MTVLSVVIALLYVITIWRPCLCLHVWQVKRGESSLLALWVRKLETEEFSSVLTLYGEATAQVNGQAYVDRIEKDISAEVSLVEYKC